MNSFHRNPVLLIHGFYATASEFDKLSDYLIKLGWPTYTLDLKPNTGDLELEYLAQQLADFVAATFSASPLCGCCERTL